MIESELLSIIFLVEVTHGKLVKRNITDSVLKTNPWTYKIKDLNEEEITKRFYEKELLLSNYK